MYLAKECQGCWREGGFWKGWQEARVSEGEREEVIAGTTNTTICSRTISTKIPRSSIRSCQTFPLLMVRYHILYFDR